MYVLEHDCAFWYAETQEEAKRFGDALGGTCFLWTPAFVPASSRDWQLIAYKPDTGEDWREDSIHAQIPYPIRHFDRLMPHVADCWRLL